MEGLNKLFEILKQIKGVKRQLYEANLKYNNDKVLRGKYEMQLIGTKR